ncbi:uncharacterized protein LOC127863640 [Dreissena polymorpha]|uniref:uncharacterized protein LOC127863640 n=1 Tax=Dreissena polymorpha TaxID=45954 RepID=UPI0022642865|nr:uncharacterized protein LOC127863640 [Dreissena polymorpha]
MSYENVGRFKLQLTPSIPGKASNRFLSRWKEILNHASFQLMGLLLGYYQHRTNVLQREENAIKSVMHHSLDPVEFEDLLSEVQKHMVSTSESYSQMKSKKLSDLNSVSHLTNVKFTNVSKTKKPRIRRFERRQPNTRPNSQPNIVVNLSSTNLTEHEQKLLSKGLNFCPKPPHIDRGSLIEDSKSFSRQLRLKSHFSKAEPLYDNSSVPIERENSDSQTETQILNEMGSLDERRSSLQDRRSPSQERLTTTTSEDCELTNNNEMYPKFKLKSKWEPPKQSVSLETFIHNVESDISEAQTNTKMKSNLTKHERQALRSLKNNNDIIIKPADKGSAVVVMDKEQYISEADRQLGDARFYRRLDSDPTQEFQAKVVTKLKEMLHSGEISDKNFDYLSVTNPRAGRFYLLPKIHKPGNPGRPIVSAKSHPTERISEFVDYHLRPHVVKLPSYVKDTTDYLTKASSDTLPSDTLLVSMDVESLFSNIPHEEGIEACKHAWETRNIKDPSTKTLVDLLTLIMKCNNFEFIGYITSKYKVQQWELKWHHHMPTFS